MSELAIREDNAVVGRADEQLVTMTIDGQLFGLPILSVQDIVETNSITRVPLAPSAICGVMNLRGRIVTLVDLRRILGRSTFSGSSMGVTVEYQNDLYTILVDKIGEVRSLDQAAFEPAPATVEPVLKQLCTGVYRLEEELLTVLDVERVLASETIAQTPPVQFIAQRQKDTKQQVSKPKRLSKPDKAEDEETVEKKDAEPSVGRKARPAKVAKPVKKKDAAPAIKEVKADVAPEATESDSEKSLYDLLGGGAAIDAAVEIFYTKILADTSLADFFDGVDMDRQRKMQKDFLTMATGGPSKYTGRSLRAAHAGLVEEKGLAGQHFDAVGGHLKATLEELDVPADLIAQALELVGSVRDDVLAGPETPSVESDAILAEPEPAVEPVDVPPSVEPAPESNLLEEMGGPTVVQAAVTAFYQKAQEDPVLGPHYEDADMAKQQNALVTFLTASLNASPNGSGRGVGGHQWLVGKKGMGDDGFNRCLELFETALKAQSVPEGLIFRILAAVERNRESIVD